MRGRSPSQGPREGGGAGGHTAPGWAPRGPAAESVSPLPGLPCGPRIACDRRAAQLQRAHPKREKFAQLSLTLRGCRRGRPPGAGLRLEGAVGAALTVSASRRRPLSEQRKSRAGRRARSPGRAALGWELPAGSGSGSGSGSGGHMAAAAAADAEARPRSLSPSLPLTLRSGGKRKPRLCGRRAGPDSQGAGAHPCRSAPAPPLLPSCALLAPSPAAVLPESCPLLSSLPSSARLPPPPPLLPLGPRLPALLQPALAGGLLRTPPSPLTPVLAAGDLLTAAPNTPSEL